MEIIKNTLYHVYNQGNNREQIFYSRENKLFFLQKLRKYISPTCTILAYCLMSNPFHFLIYATEKSVAQKTVGALCINNLMNGFRLLLSSYAQAINKQEKRTGSLFRQKTKAKALACGSVNYPLICFNYIHQNPVKAGLVTKMEDWEFSSYKDYAGLRNGNLCNKEAAIKYLDLQLDDFMIQSLQILDIDKVENIF